MSNLLNGLASLIFDVATAFGPLNKIEINSASGKLICALIVVVFVVFVVLTAKRFYQNYLKYVTARFVLEKEHKVFDDGKKCIVKVSPQEFFKDATIMYTKVPHLLTGLGILGTFIGISASFKGITDSLNNDQLESVLSGMKYAFGTSVFGLVFSLMLTAWQRSLNVINNKMKQKYIDELSPIFVKEDPIYYMRQQREDHLAKEEMFKNFSEASSVMSNVVGDLKTTLTQFGEFVDPKKTAELLSEAVSSVMVNELKPTFDGLSKKFDVLEDMRSSTKSLKETSDSLHTFITKDLGSIFSRSEKTMTQTQELITEVNKGLQTTNDSISGQLKNFQTLEGTLFSFSDELKRTLIDVKDTIHKTVEENIEQLTTSSKHLLENVGTEVAATITSANVTMTSSLNCVSDEFKQTSNFIVGELEVFKDTYTKCLDVYLSKQADHLYKYLGQNADRLYETVFNLDKVFSSTLKNSKKIVDEQNQLIVKIDQVFALAKVEEEYVKSNLELLADTVVKTSNDTSLGLRECEVQLKQISQVIGTDTKVSIELLTGTMREALEKYKVEIDKHNAVILSEILFIAQSLADTQNVKKLAS
ncbi:MAG: MotA/TolQ/ExbB proton channel family protein [Bacteriovoracaceae bacterium]|nr:MotA/TolQ/ExbB proton channel family protein [Bacteriovoracaceae bacterium]